MKSTEKHNPAAEEQSAEKYVTGSSAPGVATRTLEQALGAQIRTLRRQLDLTVSDLATSAGISIGMLSKIENGQISPSLATLQALAAALNVPITALFASFEEKRGCSYVRAGQGVSIERRGTKVGHQYELLGHSLGGDIGVEPFLITLREGAASYTAFQHGGVEYLHMLSGALVYRHGDRSYEMRPGDSLMFDSSAPHGPETLTSLPATYLSIIIYPREER